MGPQLFPQTLGFPTSIQQTGSSPLQILMASPQHFVPETMEKKKANIGVFDEPERSAKRPRIMTLDQYKAKIAGLPYIYSSPRVQEDTKDHTRTLDTIQSTSNEVVQTSSSEESTPEPGATTVPEVIPPEHPASVEEPVGSGKEKVAKAEHQPNSITESGIEEPEKPAASVKQVPETLAKAEEPTSPEATLAKAEKPTSPEASRKRKSESPTEREQSSAKKSKILPKAPVQDRKGIGLLHPLTKSVCRSVGTPYKEPTTKPVNNVTSKDTQITGAPVLKTQNEVKPAKKVTSKDTQITGDPVLKTTQNEVKTAKSGISLRKEFPNKMQNYTAKGIPNKGFFCYRNSIIQALMHVPSVYDYLSKHNEPNGDKCACPGTSCICCLLREFTIVHFSDEKGINKKQKTLEIIDKILGGEFAKIGSRHEQQDADEYLICMLEKAVEQQKKKNRKKKTALENLLEVTTTQEVICGNKSCKNRSQTKSNNTSIRAKMSGRNQAAVRLHDLVNEIEATETIKDYKCEECGKLGAIIRRQFTELPMALMVHVNRGGKTSLRGQSKKLNNWLQFEPEMFLQTSDGKSHKYVLRSVVSHAGSTLNSGHYVCFGRNPDKKTWSMCDDSTVQQVPETKFRGGKEGAPKFTPYILMYGKAYSAS